MGSNFLAISSIQINCPVGDNKMSQLDFAITDQDYGQRPNRKPSQPRDSGNPELQRQADQAIRGNPKGNKLATFEGDNVVLIKRDKKGNVIKGSGKMVLDTSKDIGRELGESGSMMTFKQYNQMFPEHGANLGKQLPAPQVKSITVGKTPMREESNDWLNMGVDAASRIPQYDKDNTSDYPVSDPSVGELDQIMQKGSPMMGAEPKDSYPYGIDMPDTKAFGLMSDVSPKMIVSSAEEMTGLTATGEDIAKAKKFVEDGIPPQTPLIKDKDDDSDTLWQAIAAITAVVAPALIGYSSYGTKGLWLGLASAGKGGEKFGEEMAKGAMQDKKAKSAMALALAKSEKSKQQNVSVVHTKMTRNGENGEPMGPWIWRAVNDKSTGAQISGSWYGPAPEKWQMTPDGTVVNIQDEASKIWAQGRPASQGPDAKTEPGVALDGSTVPQIVKPGTSISEVSASLVEPIMKVAERHKIPTTMFSQYNGKTMGYMSRPGMHSGETRSEQVARQNAYNYLQEEIKHRSRKTFDDDIDIAQELRKEDFQIKKEARQNANRLALQTKGQEFRLEMWKKNTKEKSKWKVQSTYFNAAKSSLFMKNFVTIASFYENVNLAKQEIDRKTGFKNTKGERIGGEGIADLTLIYTYVKMLDPNSVVKEGEIKILQSSLPVIAQIKNKLWDHVLTGATLNKETRDLLEAGIKQKFNQQLIMAMDIINENNKVADKFEIPRELIVPSEHQSLTRRYWKSDVNKMVSVPHAWDKTPDAAKYRKQIIEDVPEYGFLKVGGFPFVKVDGKIKPAITKTDVNSYQRMMEFLGK